MRLAFRFAAFALVVGPSSGLAQASVPLPWQRINSSGAKFSADMPCSAQDAVEAEKGKHTFVCDLPTTGVFVVMSYPGELTEASLAILSKAFIERAKGRVVYDRAETQQGYFSRRFKWIDETQRFGTARFVSAGNRIYFVSYSPYRGDDPVNEDRFLASFLLTQSAPPTPSLSSAQATPPLVWQKVTSTDGGFSADMPCAAQDAADRKGLHTLICDLPKGVFMITYEPGPLSQQDLEAMPKAFAEGSKGRLIYDRPETIQGYMSRRFKWIDDGQRFTTARYIAAGNRTYFIGFSPYKGDDPVTEDRFLAGFSLAHSGTPAP